MSWAAKEYYAEKAGKFYSFESLSQRNEAVKNHGMEKVSSQDIYRYHIRCISIPSNKYNKIIESL